MAKKKAKEAINLKENKGGRERGWREEKEGGKCCNYIKIPEK